MAEFRHLGQRSTEPIAAAGLDTFDAPAGVTEVTFSGDELTAFCPITAQPDFYAITITYTPSARCLESKSLKLYLQSFRDRPAFAEALAAEIAADLRGVLEPADLVVVLTQQKRGGLVLTVTAR